MEGKYLPGGGHPVQQLYLPADMEGEDCVPAQLNNPAAGKVDNLEQGWVGADHEWHPHVHHRRQQHSVRGGSKLQPAPDHPNHNPNRSPPVQYQRAIICGRVHLR